MILSAHQPAYLPWLGYFEKISRSDIFIFLDSVQFEKNSFINRNKIKSPTGGIWLTIPVKTKGHTTSTLIDIEVDDLQFWQAKHLKAIAMNYRKAKYFDYCYPKLQHIMFLPTQKLGELCWQQLNFWLKEFDISTKIVRSSALNIKSKKSNLILDLCKSYSADRYLSGALGANYLVSEDFSSDNIEIEYQKFDHPTYPQLWGKFESCMSVVDYWMNCGPGKINLKMKGN